MGTRELIEAAFAEVPYPGEVNIVRCRCAECQKLKAAFANTTWRDHSLEHIRKHVAAIFQFSPPALHYFLPSFMLRSLGAWEETCLVPFLIMRLFAEGPEAKPAAGHDGYRVERWTLFTPAQRRAVAAYLREYANAENVLGRDDVLRTIERLERSDASPDQVSLRR